jgi:hypothetical protein
MAKYYAYNLIDADGMVRYVGKGTGRRADYHLGVILALANRAPATRACKVHRRFAADIQNGRQFRSVVVVPAPTSHTRSGRRLPEWGFRNFSGFSL